MSKQKGLDSNRARNAGKEKSMTVAADSRQPRAPGWVAPGGANVQSANIEQMGAALRARGSLQGGLDNVNVGSQRASARQSGQRLQERGEEDRLGASRQSGYGGMEADRKDGGQQYGAGSQHLGAEQGKPTAQPASDYRSRKSKK